MRTNESASGDGSTHRSRRQLLAAAVALGASVAAGCTGSGDDGSNAGGDDGNANSPTADGTGDSSPQTTSMAAASASDSGTGATTPTDGSTGMPRETTAVPQAQGEQPTAVDDTAWRSVELSPVRRDETVTVEGFDRPVVLEAFAVWCPKCTRKQEDLRALDDSIVKISVNVDPNEDAAKVRDHADEHGFDWRYVVAPEEMIRSLVDAFGTTVTNAPSTPVVVACPGGGASFFAGRGNVGIPKIEATAGNC
ncbi:MAG: hypothetical protein V5A44_11335 [Haloarculaceae archaeon]